MYEYTDFYPLNEEEILKRVSQEEIAEMVLGYKPVMYQRIKSPIKLQRGRDNFPGARFEYWNGKLFFIDFGDQPTHRVIFKFVADYYNVKFYEGLKIINDYFKLGLGDENPQIIPKPVILHQQRESSQKQRTDIIYKPRPFNTIDKNYWMPYEISRSNLIEDEVVAAIWFKFYSHNHSKWIIIRPKDSIYAFTEFKSHVKIYRPHHKLRFVSNCDQNDIGGYSKLPVAGESLIISKSYKDHRILKNQDLINVIWFQNEGCVPNEEILIDLCERFDNIYIFFDNDTPGMEAAYKLTSIINNLYPEKALPCWIPENSNNIKDPGNMLEKGKKKELKEFLIYKGLYGKHTSNHTSILDTPPISPF